MIPEIVTVISEARDGSEQIIVPPICCPICNTKLEKDVGKIAIFCPNILCSAKILGQLEMFVSKQAMNIDGLGPRQLEEFVQLGWITDYASVFALGNYEDKMLELE